MKFYPLRVSAGIAIIFFGQVIADSDVIVEVKAAGSGNSSEELPPYYPLETPEPAIRYSLCLPQEIIPERNTKVSLFNYFSYGYSYQIFDGDFETAPVVGVVREQSGSDSTDYLAAMTENLWFWWSRNGIRSDVFQVSGSPQLNILCDTPEYKNSWVKFNDDCLPQQYPAYRIVDQRTGYALDSMLCAYPHNGKLITGIVVDQQAFQGDEYNPYLDLEYPYTCAALSVVQWGASKTVIYTTEPSDAPADDSEVPINGPLTYLLAGIPANEPWQNPECKTTQNWFTPETDKPTKQITGLDEVIQTYPPKEFIEYCLGYSINDNKLVRTVGLELAAVDYQWWYAGNPNKFTGHLAGGCFFPGAEVVVPLPWLAPNHEESDDLWARRYKTLTVPLWKGWNHYDPERNTGSRVGCRSTLGGEEPVYLCRFSNPVTMATYVYGTYTPEGNGQCEAISLYQDENSQPVYGTISSSVFQVYTGELDLADTESTNAETGEPSAAVVTVPLGLVGLMLITSFL